MWALINKHALKLLKDIYVRTFIYLPMQLLYILQNIQGYKEKQYSKEMANI